MSYIQTKYDARHNHKTRRWEVFRDCSVGQNDEVGKYFKIIDFIHSQVFFRKMQSLFWSNDVTKDVDDPPVKRLQAC